jgi:hypothetical protein
MAKPYVFIKGDAILFQFNKESNGERLVRRQPTRCACGQKVVSYKGMTIEVARDWRFTTLETYTATDRHWGSNCTKEGE